MNEHSEMGNYAQQEQEPPIGITSDSELVNLKAEQFQPMIETLRSANTICQAEDALQAMPETTCVAIAEAGFPEISKAILLGALSASMLAAPETTLAGQETITIPKEHVLRFEKDTGLKLEELAQKYGIRIDHSITTPGASKWVIHVAQVHGQMTEEAVLAPVAITKSQTKVYDVLSELRRNGVTTVFNEGHTDRRTR